MEEYPNINEAYVKQRISVHVSVNCRANSLGEWYLNQESSVDRPYLHVNLHAKRERHQANKELVSFLAKMLCLKKNDIEIIVGHISTKKIIEITCSTNDLLHMGNNKNPRTNGSVDFSLKNKIQNAFLLNLFQVLKIPKHYEKFFC
jgi:uncharacterized protein YggU (UPF0235/DUF167 family)